jgi:flagellar hook-length control protein FliK
MVLGAPIQEAANPETPVPAGAAVSDSNPPQNAPALASAANDQSDQKQCIVRFLLGVDNEPGAAEAGDTAAAVATAPRDGEQQEGKLFDALRDAVEKNPKHGSEAREDTAATEFEAAKKPVAEPAAPQGLDANLPLVTTENKHSAQEPAQAGQPDFALSPALHQSALLQHASVVSAEGAPAIPVQEAGSAPPARTADPVEPFDHTVSIIRDGNRLAVKLEPEGLGKLNIDLSLDRGTVHAHIQVADDAARNVIQDNMQQIVESLMKEGLSVGGFTVSLKNGGQQADEQANEAGQHHPRTADSVQPSAFTAAAAAGSGINLFV